jgi:hypothetical protein
MSGNQGGQSLRCSECHGSVGPDGGFLNDPHKKQQWTSFVSRLNLGDEAPSLEKVGAILRAFLLPCVSSESLTNASSILGERIEWIGWKPMNNSTIFLLGALGALAPEIVRLYSMRNSPSRFRWSWFYLVVSLLFASLGGVIALALPAVTYWGAIYTGVSTPVLINTILKKANKERPLKSIQAPAPRRVSFWSFVEGL